MAGMDNEVLYGTRCRVNDGSVSAPAFTYANDLDSGIYRIGENNQAVACGGVSPMNWTDTLTSCTSQFYALVTELSHILERTTATTNNRVTPLVVRLLCSGTALNGFGPDIDFQGENSAGSTVSFGRLAFYASDITAGSIDTVLLVRAPINSVDTDIFFASGDQAGFRDGTASLPGIAFIGDTNTGIYRIGSDNMGFAAGGAAAGSTNGSQWFFRDGSSGIPGISFLNDTNTGFRRSAADTFHVVTGGTDRMTWDDQGRTRILQGYVTGVTKTATDYVVLNTDNYIGVTSTAAARNMTLTSANFISGQEFTFKDESMAAGTNNITLTPSSGTIDNQSTAVINTNGGSLRVKFDGTNYWLL